MDYLEEGVVGVERGAVGADGGAAVEAEDVLLVLATALVGLASDEEALLHQSPQPSGHAHPHRSF